VDGGNNSIAINLVGMNDYKAILPTGTKLGTHSRVAEARDRKSTPTEPVVQRNAKRNHALTETKFHTIWFDC
jgi:hypothetical protein